MSSITNMNDNMTAAILAGEAEFKHAMKSVNDELSGRIDSAIVAKTALSATHIFDDSEVICRPAAQQWTVRTP